MVLVDTCGWIEWLTDGDLAKQYAPYFDKIGMMLVPTSVQFELYKWTVRNYSMQLALEAVALTEQGLVLPLTTNIALSAADISVEYKLSFADAIVYATAKLSESELVTSDSHFQGLPSVTYFNKI